LREKWPRDGQVLSLTAAVNLFYYFKTGPQGKSAIIARPYKFIRGQGGPLQIFFTARSVSSVNSFFTDGSTLKANNRINKDIRVRHAGCKHQTDYTVRDDSALCTGPERAKSG